MLERRATENYFPDHLVKSVIGPSFRAPGPFESFDNLAPKWNKNENWKIARKMSLDDLAGNDLGAFFESLEPVQVAPE